MAANENDIKLKGSFNSKKDDRGGASIIPSAVIGIVKNNIDLARSGKIEVFLQRGNSDNQDNPRSWTTVNYMSPFFGYTQNTSSKDDNGNYEGNPNSYGMWMTPPDIGSEVLCVFLLGDINSGYYIGGLPKPGMTHMVPAVGSSTSVILNESEAKSYGGAKKLPVTELNNANKKLKDSPTIVYSPRPVHSYQADILFNQGLLNDNDRGAISSSSMRESPSKVFGISTPGRPIYQGGYDDTTIGDAIKADAPNENFKITGRRGGHSFVMDDGDLYGKDQLIRLRTAGGHTIMMNDYAQTLMIMHANGQSYIELGREGTIDMYSTNSVNIRTEGDLNLHADRNVNIKATGDLNMSGKNTKVESLESMTQYAGNTFQGYSKGDYTVKTESNYASVASGDMGLKSTGTVFIKGGLKDKPNVRINSGDISTTPKEVKQIEVKVHSDTLYDDTKGYNPAPSMLSSIVSRAPAHMPWDGAGKGIDVKINKSAAAAFPSPPSASVGAVNAAVSKTPSNPTNTSFAATVPTVGDVGNLTKGLDTTLSTPALTGMISQMAVQAAAGPLGPAVLNGGAGVLTNGNGIKVAGVGSFAFNAAQMSATGVIKPGSEVAVNYALNSGKTLEQAMPNNIFTGQNGVTNLNQYVNDVGSQAKSAASLLVQGESALKSSGIISGNEHSTQTGGLIMSVASLGLKATTDFLSTTVANPIASGLNPAGIASSLANGMAGSAKDIIAGGNFAANLADKSMVALSGIKLGGIDVAASIKGFASSLYASVLSSIKPFKPNVPQDLTAIAAAAASATDAASPTGALGIPAAISSAVSSALPSIIPGVNLDSLGGLPGAADAISNNISNPITSTGIKNISSAVKNIADNINGSQLGSGLASAKSLLTGGSLATVALGGIDPAQLSKLNGLLSSIGNGALNISLPSTITNAFDTSGLLASAKAKLGGKVPAPIFGTGNAPEANTAGLAKLGTLSQSITDEQVNYEKLNTAYQTALGQYGADDAQTKSAYTALTKSAQTLETLQSQISKTVIV